MGGVSPDAIFNACVAVVILVTGFLIKLAIDFAVMKTKIKAAHSRLDILNGKKSDDDKGKGKS